MTIAITGSTGAVGGATARALAAEQPLRLIVRDAARAPELPGASVALANYGDREASLRALDGVDTLFMVSGAENERRLDEHRTFVSAAAAAGVRHIVYTSFIGASAHAVFTLGRDHGATEGFIHDSGMAYTILRDNFYADFMQYMVGEDDVLRGPAGDGRVSIVARSDVARVAATVLRDPARHLDRTYELTGPEALTLSQIAGVLAAATGRGIRYHDETIDEAYASRAKYGAPDWQVDAWVSTYTSIAAGEVAGVSSDIQRITAAAPLSLADVMAARAPQ